MLRRLIGDVVHRVEGLQQAAPREPPRREVVRPAPEREDWGLAEGGDRPSPRPRGEPDRSQPDPRQELVAALSSPSGLRRAFLLQEILGPPKALRDRDDSSPWRV